MHFMARKPGSKAIVIHGDKICLVLRDNNPDIAYPNVWNTPGGGIDEGETPREAMIRELKEEINLDATKIIDLGTTTYSDGSIVYRFFIPVTDEQLEGIRLVSEGQRLDWFTFDEVLALPKSPHLSVYLETFGNDIKAFLGGRRKFDQRNETLEIS